MSSAYDSILALEDVSFSYGGGFRMGGLGLGVREGEFMCLIGANGSGKSTVLKLLGGLLRPASGSVKLWGKPIGAYRNRDRAKLVSYLPQTLDMNLPFRVSELAAMGAYPYDRPTGTTLEDALRMVGLERERESLLLNLSGGEKRRAFIAMTLLQGAGILLLDEPLANLDVRYQLDLVRLLRGLNRQRNISVVMSLHDISMAFHFDRVALIKEGRLLASGPPEAVLGEDMLREAFGIGMKVGRAGGGFYVSYGPDG